MNKINFKKIEELYNQIEKSNYSKSVIALNKSQPPFISNERPFHGFRGVILYDWIIEKIQCSICGKWYKALNGRHLEKDFRKGLSNGRTGRGAKSLILEFSNRFLTMG